MSNKKNKPAAGKSVAGKSNSNMGSTSEKRRKNEKERAEAEKRARRIIEEKQKAQREREKKSAELHKRREKEAENELKIREKSQNKQTRKNKRKNVWKKLRYYSSREFLSSFNYKRIFLFIVLPIVLIAAVIISVLNSVFVNVPAEIRSYEYSGRTESDAVAPESPFNSQQKQVLIDSLHSKGSNKFEFYINSAVKIDDEARTESLCFGNPNPENCVLVLTVFDSDGKMIYRSLGLKSGAELNNIKLFYELPYGLQEVTAAVNAYDGQTNEKIGTRYAEIKLAVGVDENGK